MEGWRNKDRELLHLSVCFITWLLLSARLKEAPTLRLTPRCLHCSLISFSSSAGLFIPTGQVPHMMISCKALIWGNYLWRSPGLRAVSTPLIRLSDSTDGPLPQIWFSSPKSCLKYKKFMFSSSSAFASLFTHRTHFTHLENNKNKSHLVSIKKWRGNINVNLHTENRIHYAQWSVGGAGYRWSFLI